MTKEQTRKYNSFYQIITTVNTTPEQKYELLESFVDAIIKEEISQEKEKMIEAQKTIILFQKAGQCSSLHKAHVNNEYDNGWNCAVNAMLHYLKQPTLEEYQKAINLLQNK